MSGDTGRLSSREVADEAEDTRAHLATTLQQLRTNLRPENVVDEVMSNARAGAATVADGLAEAAKANPLPSLLIAAGAVLALGVLSRKRISGAAQSPLLGSREVSIGSQPGRRVEDASSATIRQVRDYVSDRRTDLAGGVDQVKRHAADVYQATAAGTRDAVQSVSRYLPQDRTEMKSKLSNLLDDQPLVLGAIGLAVGAAIGAALPISETEDNLLGGSAHQLRQAASDVARHEIDGLRAAAGDVVEDVRRTAADHGLSSENFSGLVKDVGNVAKSAVSKVGTAHEA